MTKSLPSWRIWPSLSPPTSSTPPKSTNSLWNYLSSSTSPFSKPHKLSRPTPTLSIKARLSNASAPAKSKHQPYVIRTATNTTLVTITDYEDDDCCHDFDTDHDDDDDYQSIDSSTTGRTRSHMVFTSTVNTKNAPPSPKTFRCNICQTRCPSWSALLTHFQHYKHHQQIPTVVKTSPTSTVKRQVVTFQCPVCEGKFPSRLQLTEHLKHYHRNTPFLRCPHCDAMFSNSSKVKAHVQMCHSTLHCYRCKFVANEPDELLEHYNDYHLKCRYCNQRFPFIWAHQQKCPARKLH